jgi:type IV pilus assembly protein PilY1
MHQTRRATDRSASWPTTRRATALALTLAACGMPAAAGVPIGNNPLYLVSGKANLLVILDNSNSMDEDASGAAVGSNSPDSKSEIARGVVRNLTTTYKNRVNLGLMRYKQNTPADNYLHNSPYDASYDPATYDPSWTGARDSATHKRFRMPNVSSPGEYIYYNVALPFYAGSSQGNRFCYSPSANAFNNGEDPSSGPWDTYRCFPTKTGTSNALPTWNNATSEAAQGYSGGGNSYTFHPTDSDFAQGILDFGKLMSWNVVGRTWLRNESPGRGYLEVPIKALDTTQGNTIKTKLACNIPGDPSPCTSSGIKNAGLTPLEGTLYTAKDYFKGGDGSWSNTSEGYTASCYPLPNSCGKDFVILLTDGLPSTDKNGALVAVPSTAIAQTAAAAAALKAAGIETYVIGFALPFGTDPTTLDAIAAAGGTGTAYSADNTASLEAAFKSIFDDVFRKTSAFGAVSQNSTAINDGSRVYQGRFDSTDWSGELEALKPKQDGTMVSQWSTNDAGRFAAPSTRKVFTYKPGSGGVAFKLLSDLDATQQGLLATGSCGGALGTGSACAQARIDWMRGDTTNEESTGPLRKRTRVLGDIISSSPYYVADTRTLYVGANDGMLHAFDADTGNELFAYVPNGVMDRLYKLTSPVYSHEYFVDGEVTVSTRAETPGKNILVGTLGRGGKTLFALDVSSPASFAATKVLWEYSEADLGVSLGKPFVAKLNNGKTAVLVGNGYNGASERAVLFIIDIETGALIRKLDTQAGSSSASNGLASARGWDRDADGTLDIAYAGDRLGNVWKWDLSASNSAVWAPAFGTAAAPQPLFVATDAYSVRQPITGGISVGLNTRKGDPNFGKIFVFVGTGQYLISTDVTDKAVQTWYGLVDDGTQISDRTTLKSRYITAEAVVSGSTARTFSTATAGDMAGKRGWMIDLVPSDGIANGERIVSDNKFLGSVLVATSIVPTNDICVPGGGGFLNAIDPFSGASTRSAFFDANKDGSFTLDDALTVAGKKVVIGSISPDNNLPSEAILIGNRLIASGTSGQIRSVGANNPIRTGRIAWREIVRQN